MTWQELKGIAMRYAHDELKDNHASVETIVAAAFLNGIDYAEHHPHWISVEEELPKDGEYVATINTVGVKDVRHYSHGKWYSNFGNEYDDITHWMPLPEPPKEGVVE